MQPNRLLPWLAILLAGFCYLLQLTLTALPGVVRMDADPASFSAERAFGNLQQLLHENIPHPVGSPQNRIVRQRIEARLDSLGVASSIQVAWGCSPKYNRCARAENIIATIPGDRNNGYIALMAHYDSVPTAPGAGDDGSAVASILETVRALKLEAPFERPILLIFTDAEEVGLLGAEAFFANHPLAGKIEVLLNYEGSGTTGPSNLLRTSPLNNRLIEAYGQAVPERAGMSLINEVFKRMPNDTDFSVAQRAGQTGMDFAFANERNHYHTPNDNLANINLNTIQHQGNSMLPLVRLLAAAPALKNERRVVYSNEYGMWIQWPTGWHAILFGFSAVLLIVATLRQKIPFRFVLAAIPASLATIVIGAIAAYGFVAATGWLKGTIVSWPASDLPYRLGLVSAGLGSVVAVAGFLRYFLKPAALLLGFWWLWAGLTLALINLAPDAANLFLLPLLASSLVLCIATAFRPDQALYIELMCLILLVPATLGLVLPLELSQGYRLAITFIPFLALFGAGIMPFLMDLKWQATLPFTALAVAASLVWVSVTPLYSDQRPQHLNFYYYEDADQQEAFYRYWSPNPLPPRIARIMAFDQAPGQLLPFSEAKMEQWQKTESTGLVPPSLEVLSESRTMDGRRITLEIQSQRNATQMALYVPSEAGLTGYVLDGQPFRNILATDEQQPYASITLFGQAGEPVQITLELDSKNFVSGFLADVTSELPSSANPLINARGAEASPVHRGDQALSFSRVVF